MDKTMLDRTSPNPRERIGANNPPGALELAKPIVEELGQFLNDFPVIANDGEARKAKAISDRVFLALKSVEEERDSKVRPLNERVAATPNTITGSAPTTRSPACGAPC